VINTKNLTQEAQLRQRYRTMLYSTKQQAVGRLAGHGLLACKQAVQSGPGANTDAVPYAVYLPSAIFSTPVSYLTAPMRGSPKDICSMFCL